MKVDQNMKILQQALSGLSGKDGATINIITIETMSVGASGPDLIPEPDQPERRRFPRQQAPVSELKRLPWPENSDEMVLEFLEKLPEPRFDALIFAIMKTCVQEGMARSEISEFLGIPSSTVDTWTRKYGLKRK